MDTTYLGADEMALDLRMDIPEGATFMAIGLIARPHCSAESRITAAKTLRCILLCPSSDRGARGEGTPLRGDGAAACWLRKRSAVLEEKEQEWLPGWILRSLLRMTMAVHQDQADHLLLDLIKK